MLCTLKLRVHLFFRADSISEVTTPESNKLISLVVIYKHCRELGGSWSSTICGLATQKSKHLLVQRLLDLGRSFSTRRGQALHINMGSMNHELQFLQSNRFPEELENSETQALRKERQISRKILVFASTVAVTGIICLVIGIALLRMNESQSNDDSFSATLRPDGNTRLENDDCAIKTLASRNFTESCSYSQEFKESGKTRVALVILISSVSSSI